MGRCSLSSEEFERHADGFQSHVKKEHNMWAYLFFMFHLERKDSERYTANENYFAECVGIHNEEAENDDDDLFDEGEEEEDDDAVCKCFPINSSLSLHAAKSTDVFSFVTDFMTPHLL